MKKLPISIQTFEKIRKEGNIYVDKTNFVHQLVTRGTYYFLARPRRFGKSLLLTTLKSFFEGKQELFEGLFIYKKERSWKKYPVIHIDYSLIEYKKSRTFFETSLLNQINKIAVSNSIKLQNTIIADAFSELVTTLYEKFGPVVILVDEYDKAMVDLLTEEKRFEENREVLRGLYGAMKGLDAYLRFVMLTGVSRFAKVNVFSGLNNLEDISMDESFSAIAGFTQSELETYFKDHLKGVQKKFGFSWQELLQQYKHKYNGYSWDGNQRLYNPFSILKSLKEQDFGNYWFSTGTPSFLIELAKKQKALPAQVENTIVADLIGHSSNFKTLPLMALLFQTGYLTIVAVEREGINKYYHLGYPNDEVQFAFTSYLLAMFVGKDEFDVQPEAIWLRRALKEENTEKFLKLLGSFLADIPARLHVKKEAYYHSLIYLILRLLGVRMLLEKETNRGRIDAVLEFDDKVYIIEFKFGTNTRVKKVETLSKQALAQIVAKRYHEPYLSLNKKIILLGIGYLNKKLDGKTTLLDIDQPS